MTDEPAPDDDVIVLDKDGAWWSRRPNGRWYSPRWAVYRDWNDLCVGQFSPVVVYVPASRLAKLTERAERAELLLIQAEDYVAEQSDELAEAEARHERELSEEIDQRDAARDALDLLAYAIGTVEQIGEHSNLNDPWANALDLLAEERARAAEAEATIARVEALCDALGSRIEFDTAVIAKNLRRALDGER